jgi:hypothetical protein
MVLFRLGKYIAFKLDYFTTDCLQVINALPYDERNGCVTL